MSRDLADIRYQDGIRQSRYAGFGGLDRTTGCRPNEFRQMENLSDREYPAVSPARKRKKITEVTEKLRGYLVKDGSFYGINTSGTLYDYTGGVSISTGFSTAEGKRTILQFNNKYLVFPEARASTAGSAAEMITVSKEAQTCSITNGTIYGVSATDNTIKISGSGGLNVYDAFNVGDTLKIYKIVEGTRIALATATLREKEFDQDNYPELRFDDNTFAGKTETNAKMEFVREVPKLTGAFISRNRVWGWIGNRIYCSALGDAMNFQRFDGLSTDAWTVDVAATEGFVAGMEHNGYPTFLAPDKIVTVYGSYPAEFYTSETNGGMLGCKYAGTAVSCGGALYYLSMAGVCRWAGGQPQVISRELGVIAEGTSATTDGRRYYLMARFQGESRLCLLVYDTLTGLWMRESGGITTEGEEPTFHPFEDLQAFDGRCYALSDGYLFEIGSAGEPGGRGYMTAFFETGAETVDTELHKHLNRIRIRAQIDTGAVLTVMINCDDEKENGATKWRELGTLTGTGALTSYNLFVKVRPNDHYHLRFEGEGRWVLHAISPEYEKGEYR